MVHTSPRPNLDFLGEGGKKKYYTIKIFFSISIIRHDSVIEENFEGGSRPHEPPSDTGLAYYTYMFMLNLEFSIFVCFLFVQSISPCATSIMIRRESTN